jgi:hypothetical protein
VHDVAVRLRSKVRALTALDLLEVPESTQKYTDPDVEVLRGRQFEQSRPGSEGQPGHVVLFCSCNSRQNWLTSKVQSHQLAQAIHCMSHSHIHIKPTAQPAAMAAAAAAAPLTARPPLVTQAWVGPPHHPQEYTQQQHPTCSTSMR